MPNSTDKALALHAAPVLLGKKAGSLFWLHAAPKALGFTASYLRKNGVRLTTMAQKGGRWLVYLYRPAQLAGMLAQPKAACALQDLGYPHDLRGCLLHLKRRLAGGDEFPHEIGFFLGYPTDDVLGFMQHKGRGYKYCGAWKVYGDVEHAKQLFAQHEACRRTLVDFVEKGGTLQRYCTAAAV